MLESTAANLIKGFQYPEMACATITLDQVPILGRHALSCKKTKTSLQSEIVVNGKARGLVKVGYLQDSDFLEEEKKLIKEISHMISKAIEKHELQLELKKYVGNLKDLVKAKTRELEKSKKRFEDLFENAPDGIVISEIERRHSQGQPGLLPDAALSRRRLGQAELREKQAVCQYPPHPPHYFQKAEGKRLSGGNGNEPHRRQGQPVPGHGVLHLVDFDGRRCIEEVYKDIRLRKELEQKLIEQNENLEKIVQKRTADLENQKNLLVNKNEELLSLTEKLNESKNKLQTLFDAITDQVVMIDRDFNIKMANRKEGADSGKCFAKIFNSARALRKMPGGHGLPAEEAPSPWRKNTGTNTICCRPTHLRRPGGSGRRVGIFPA